LAKNLQNSRILEVDGNLRVLGAEGSMFGLGDNAKVTSFVFQERRNSVKAAAVKLFKEADADGSGYLDPEEFNNMIFKVQKDYPQFEGFMGVISRESIAKVYETKADATKGISLDIFLSVCEEADRTMKNLPPTAQVASQQGKYLAKILNNVPYEDLAHPEGFQPIFEYKHAGSMAYIGGEHAAIDSPELGVQAGMITYVLWKGVYWSNAVSFKNKVQLVFDWAKSWFLGRDTARF
jgi:NADH:ubiquinone reductase (non-electrogenic)